MNIYKIIIAVVYIGAFIACSDDDLGPIDSRKWILEAQYVDPGDGSGEFMDVESDKSIEFNPDSTVMILGSLCSMSTESEETTSGRYDEDRIYIDCGFAPVSPFRYSFANNRLFISYPCIEPCQERYRRIE